jgi:hypothetical protein
MEAATGCFFFYFSALPLFPGESTPMTFLRNSPNLETLVIHSVISPRSEYHERVMKRRTYPGGVRTWKR